MTTRVLIWSSCAPDPRDAWAVEETLGHYGIACQVGSPDQADLDPERDVVLVPYALSEPELPGGNLLHPRRVAVVADTRWGFASPIWPGLGWEADVAARQLAGPRATSWLTLANGIVCFSEEVRATLEHLFPAARSKIHVIPPGPPIVSAQSGARGRHLLIATHLFAEGNLPAALGALRVVAATIDCPPIVVVGPGTERLMDPHETAPARQLGFTPGSDLWGLGELPAAERAALMQTAQAILLPHAHLGAPDVLAQALAAERPVACPDLPMFADLLRRTDAAAATFDPLDVLDMRRAVGTLLRDVARRERMAAGNAERTRALDREATAAAWRAALAEAGDETPLPAPAVRVPRVRSATSAGRLVVYGADTLSIGGTRFGGSLLDALSRAIPGRVVVATSGGASGDPRADMDVDVVECTGDLGHDLELTSADVVYAPWPHSLDCPQVGPATLACTWHDFNFARFATLMAETRDHSEREAPRWFARSRVVFHSTRFIASEMRELYPAFGDKVRVIAPALIELPEVDDRRVAILREKWGLPQRFLLVPGGYHSHKNQDAIIRALRPEQTSPGAHVVFTGPRTERLDGILPGALGLGTVPATDLSCLYAMSSGVIAPSLYEAGSFPIMEAMAAARPVAASRIPAHVEQVERTDGSVIWFDPRDEEDVARAIASLWDGDGPIAADLRRMEAAIRLRTWRDVAEDYLATFGEIGAWTGRMAA